VQLAKLTLAVAGGRREEGGKEDLGSEQQKKRKKIRTSLPKGEIIMILLVLLRSYLHLDKDMSYYSS